MKSGRFFLVLASAQYLMIIPGVAQDMKGLSLASDLGSVLVAEEFCDLSYKQSAIKDFISENVPANDMSFASTLTLMTSGKEVQQKEMSPSQKTAHCTQISRVAESYGFIP